MKLILGLFTVLLIIGVGVRLSQDYFKNAQLPFTKTPTITIKNKEFKLYTANTAKEKELGLSEKKSMPENYGMVFPFGQDSYYSFWMKNMKFPIDILFINNNKIVTIHHNVAPPKSLNETLPIYTSNKLADTVLEINAGLSKKYGFKDGDEVKFKDVEPQK